MTVNTVNITSGPYTGTNTTDQYSYNFRVDKKTQLNVYETTDLGVKTLLVVDTDYTVAGIGNDNGGIITRVAGNLPTDYVWFIRSDYEETQLTAFRSQGGFKPQVHEAAMDKLTFLIQQLQDATNRSLRLSDDVGHTGVSVVLPEPVANTTIIWDVTAQAFIVGPTADQISSAQGDAADAETARIAAELAQTGAETAETNAGVSETNAAASAVSAQEAADSVIYNDVQSKTFSDTPIAVVQADDGALISVDTSGGNVVINLPSIAALALPFTISVKKSTGDANTVTVNRDGTDTISGAASLVISVQGNGATLIPDTDFAPDKWSVAQFGTSTVVTEHLAELETVANDNPHGIPLAKRNATTAPTANNDNTEGYGVGSEWDDVTGNTAYVCLDASTGAAVWLDTTASGGGITLGTPVATTSGTSIDFTSIPAGTKRITFMFDGVSVSGTSPLLVQIGDSGGIETSGYVATAQNGTAELDSTAGIPLMSSIIATDLISGALILNLENSTNFTWAAAGVFRNAANNAGHTAGSKSLSAELDRIRLTTVGGTDTFDAGEINISYE